MKLSLRALGWRQRRWTKRELLRSAYLVRGHAQPYRDSIFDLKYCVRLPRNQWMGAAYRSWA